MCYDVSFKANLAQIKNFFPDIQFDEPVEEDADGFDHVQGVSVFGRHPVVYNNREDFAPHCKWMEWGCIAFYEKAEPDWKRRNGMLNIRAERILDDNKSYWYKIRNRRCLVPVTGIYEHREVKGFKKKVPYFVRPAAQPLFFLPGLYSVAELPDTETGELLKRWSFGIITRSANRLMQAIHNSGDNNGRMPLFLPAPLSKAFLSEELNEKDYRELLQYEMPSEELMYHTVHTIRTPKPRPDGKEKHEAFVWEGLPELF